MPVSASEYCIKRYEKNIQKVSVELSGRLNEQVELDESIRKVYEEQESILAELGAILADDPELKNPENRERVTELTERSESNKRQRSELEQQGYANNDRIVELRDEVPIELQGKMRGCLQAVKPANTLVNFAIQGYALAATGGLSLLLPEKTLYVDMGEVLHGKPLGGDGALIPKARDDALDALGIGGDARIIIEDPKQIFPWEWD